MSITLALDWFSVILVTIAFLISMLIGFWVGDREASNLWHRQWARHMKHYHGIDVE